MPRTLPLARGAKRSSVWAVLLLPILFSCVGAWEVGRGAAARAHHRERAAELAGRVEALHRLERLDGGATARPRDGRTATRVGAALARLRREQDAAAGDLLAARLREPAAWLAMLAGLAAAGSGAAGLGLASWAARGGLRSRPALVAAFEKVRRFVPFALVAQVGGLALALLGSVAFEAGGLWFLPDPEGRVVALAMLGAVYAGLALWGGYKTLRELRRALRLFAPEPTPLLAFPVVEAEAPGLFALMRELVGERRSLMPDVVAVGATDGFFVTAFPYALRGASVEGGEVVTRGRTLHLPLPTMAALGPAELRAVLAHELAHFSGEDTDYSLRFQPLYAGLGQGAAAMSVRGIDWGSTLPDRLLERALHPHTALAVHVFERFDLVVRHWSRVRELEADRAAAASGSPEALASSLLRVALVDDLVRAELRRVAQRPDAAPPDLSARVAARARADGIGDPRERLGDRTPHPTDTHPPASRRIEAVGVAIDDALLARAARPVADAELAAVRALFADWDALSRRVADDVRLSALERRREDRERLREAAGAAGEATVELRESLVRPTLALALWGTFCLALSVGCVLAALYGGPQDREAWPLLGAVAGLGLVGLGFGALWTVRLLRGGDAPYLVLTPEGIRSPGLAGAVPWLSVHTLQVSAVGSPTTSFHLRPDAELPRRTGRIRRLKIDRERRAVQFMGMLPRGLSAAALQELLLRYANAAHARAALDEGGRGR